MPRRISMHSLALCCALACRAGVARAATTAGGLDGGSGGSGGGTNVGGGGAGLHVTADETRITLEGAAVQGGRGGDGGVGGVFGGGNGGDGGPAIFVRGSRNTVVLRYNAEAGGGGLRGAALAGGQAGADGALDASADIAGTGNELLLANSQTSLYGDLRLGAGNTLRGEGYVGGRVQAGGGPPWRPARRRWAVSMCTRGWICGAVPWRCASTLRHRASTSLT